MTRKQRRTLTIAAALTILGFAAFMMFRVLGDTMVFFFTPSELAEKTLRPGQLIRLGGMVETGSWNKGDGIHQEFVLTDTIKTMKVRYTGAVPDLFREGQGAVAEGVVQPDGTFLADSVLAKHDEKYMPKELASSLKAKGVKLGKGAGQ
ncbi:MAG: cytochrome c maturation protein CcmE [Alphaproteobacteria bacterium]|nr:cytochrome c maturation protein CcmE [Alphaproteobacteria bacterium]